LLTKDFHPGVPPPFGIGIESREIYRLDCYSRKIMGNVLLSLIALPALEEVAAVLYPPAYISLESALFMHGVMDQAPHLLTCVSTNKTRIFRTALGEIAYFHLKKELFFGYEMKDRAALAWPEKAALDYIYLQSQNGIEPSLNEWNWENLDRNKLRQLARSYPRTVRKKIEKFQKNLF